MKKKSRMHGGHRVKREGWYGADGKVRRGLPNIAAFHRELERLKARHFVKDGDGDYPVQVLVVDRTTHRRLHYAAQPTLGLDVPTAAQAEEELRWASLNLSLASNEILRAEHDVRDALRGLSKKKGGA